jgi:hypothetical protein
MAAPDAELAGHRSELAAERVGGWSVQHRCGRHPSSARLPGPRTAVLVDLTPRRWLTARPVNVYVIEHRDGVVLFDSCQDRRSVTDP